MKYTFVNHLRTLYTLRLYIERNGYAPTIRELAALRGMGVHGIYSHLRILAERGYITNRPGEWRNLELTERGKTE